jgi:hypothetical protein
MLNVARTLSRLSVVPTILAIDSWRLHILPWGFEGTGYVAAFSFLLAGILVLSALAIVIVRGRSGVQEGLFLAALPAAASLLALVALLIACPAGC